MPVEKSPEQLELDKLVQNAREAIKVAQAHADEKGLSFSFSIAAGHLKATYFGKNANASLADHFGCDEEEAEGYRDELVDGWYSSYFSY